MVPQIIRGTFPSQLTWSRNFLKDMPIDLFPRQFSVLSSWSYQPFHEGSLGSYNRQLERLQIRTGGKVGGKTATEPEVSQRAQLTAPFPNQSLPFKGPNPNDCSVWLIGNYPFTWLSGLKISQFSGTVAHADVGLIHGLLWSSAEVFWDKCLLVPYISVWCPSWQ